jgi:hypothetical protein
MDFDDLIRSLAPPPNRRGKSDNDLEHHLYEGAVMVAYAMHLLRTEATIEVRIHPDGEHGKQFPFSDWLACRGFTMVARSGKTSYGGTYSDATGRRIIVNPKSGRGEILRPQATLSFQPSANVELSTHAIQVRCRGWIRVFARPSAA